MAFYHCVPSLAVHWGPWKGKGEGEKPREGRERKSGNDGGHEREGAAGGRKSKLRKQSRPLTRICYKENLE